jgi:PIN domain nuclease of toxin-antitoxin system
MSGPLLIDTCVALWMMDDRLAAPAVEALGRAIGAGKPTYVSPITAWEIGSLARKGRFRSSYTPQRWFERLVTAPGMKLAEITAGILMESQLLPGPMHGDPADRIIAATAREYGFTVMTRDRALLDYAAQGYLSAVEC